MKYCFIYQVLLKECVKHFIHAKLINQTIPSTDSSPAVSKVQSSGDSLIVLRKLFKPYESALSYQYFSSWPLVFSIIGTFIEVHCVTDIGPFVVIL